MALPLKSSSAKDAIASRFAIAMGAPMNRLVYVQTKLWCCTSSLFLLMQHPKWQQRQANLPLEPEYVWRNPLAKHPGGLSLIRFNHLLRDGRYRVPLR